MAPGGGSRTADDFTTSTNHDVKGGRPSWLLRLWKEVLTHERATITIGAISMLVSSATVLMLRKPIE